MGKKQIAVISVSSASFSPRTINFSCGVPLTRFPTVWFECVCVLFSNNDLSLSGVSP